MPPTGKAALDFVSRFSLLFCAGRFRPKLYRIVTLVESGQAQQEKPGRSSLDKHTLTRAMCQRQLSMPCQVTSCKAHNLTNCQLCYSEQWQFELLRSIDLNKCKSAKCTLAPSNKLLFVVCRDIFGRYDFHLQ